MTARRVALVLTAFAAMAAPAAAGAAQTASYVALGDSYTAGSGLLPFDGSPHAVPCWRSTANYPHLVAATIAAGHFTDVSCSGATTKNMLEPQSFNGDSNPPQFLALNAGVDLVTVGIGGNDVPFAELISACGERDTLRPTGSPCKDHFSSGGVDTTDAKIAAVAPKLAAVIQGIHSRAPAARVLVVGYPDLFPPDKGCWPGVPISSGDVTWLDGFVKRLDAMIAQQAQANAAEFVDTYTSSVGHDMCKPNGTKWVEGLIPTENVSPAHPNAAGARNLANQVNRVLAHVAAPGASQPLTPCKSTRRFSIRIRPVNRVLRHVVVRVGGHAVRARRITARRWTATIDLRGLGGDAVTVTTRATYRDARHHTRTLHDSRRYRTCQRSAA
jgi:lysophospholipase L1-like esterase